MPKYQPFDVVDDYVPIHDEFEQAGVDTYATPLDKLMSMENLGHNVAYAMNHPYGEELPGG